MLYPRLDEFLLSLLDRQLVLNRMQWGLVLDMPGRLLNFLMILLLHVLLHDLLLLSLDTYQVMINPILLVESPVF